MRVHAVAQSTGGVDRALAATPEESIDIMLTLDSIRDSARINGAI